MLIKMVRVGLIGKGIFKHRVNGVKRVKLEDI